MGIKIYKIKKFFHNIKVLNKVSLEIKSGEMTALLGPSGSGKTTLLRIIAGLEYQDSGSVYFSEVDVSHIHARARRVGFVFQNYALFRHMTVTENISFGMKILPKYKRPTKSNIISKVNYLLEMMQLSDLGDRYPAQLSGGQKQRVAFARSLAVEPKILLLDEPFGALDTRVRRNLRCWLRRIHKELRFTGIFVTHDQEEAMEIANKIVVMNKGSIEQVGTPQDVWCFPNSRFILEFLGDVNKLIGEIRGSQLYLGNYCFSLFKYTFSYQGVVDIFFRPWEMKISVDSNERSFLPVTVIDVSLRGYYWQLGIQPIGWHHGILTMIVIFEDKYHIPQVGDIRYLSCQNVYIYFENKLLCQRIYS